MHDQARVVAENVYEGHMISETEGAKRLIGINELESVVKEERILEGETRIVGERELERRRTSNVRHESRTTR
jgi:hypothetical protein